MKFNLKQFSLKPEEGERIEEESTVGLLTRPRVSGSSLKQGTSEVSGFTIVLVAIAVILLALGFFGTDNAITQTAFFAAAAVFAIFARIAQASRQHAEMMDELRRCPPAAQALEVNTPEVNV